MRFELQSYALAEAVKQVAPFAGTGSDPKPYQCILVAADGDAITLTAQNFLAWVRLPIIGAKIERPGAALVPAADLRRWLATCPSVPLTFDAAGDVVRLTDGRAKCELPLLPANEFPKAGAREDVERTEVVVTGGEFVRACQCTLFAVDKKAVHKTVRTDALLIDIEADGVTFMATDTKALSIVRLPAASTNGCRGELLPAGSMSMLLPMVEGAGDVRISLSRHDAIITTERSTFGTRLIESERLPYKRLLAKWDRNTPERVALPCREFLATLRQVVAGDPECSRLNVEISTEFARLWSGKSEGFVDLPGGTVHMAFAIDHEYMIDALNQIIRQERPATIEWGLEPKSKGDAGSLIIRAGEDWRYCCVTLIN